MTLLLTDEERLWGKISIDRSTIKKITTTQPKYLYRDGQTTFPTPSKGISEIGPFDYNTGNSLLRRQFEAIKIIPFIPRSINNVRENLSKLLEYLTAGYFEQRKGAYGTYADIYFQGLKKEFRLADVSVDDFIEYSPGNLAEIVNKIDFNLDALRSQKIIPLAVVGGTSHRSYRDDRGIYLEVKREFIKRDIPSQFVSWYEPQDATKLGILPAVKTASSFGFAIWNIAVSMYGKCGGVPWTVLQSKDTSGNSLIDLTIGIRFSYNRQEQGNGYHIGQATIFDHYGKCIASFTSDPFTIPYEKLRSEGMVVPTEIMKKIILDAIRLVKTHPLVGALYSQKPSLNLAIHRQSVFHNEEINGLEAAISEQSGHSIKYALVAISHEPYVMVMPETNSSQVGECVILNKKTALAYTARPIAGQPISYPLLIMAQNLGDDKNPFSDISEVCQHVIDLTGLHWQTIGFNTVQMPATLHFASEVGKNYSHGIFPSQNSWLRSTNWFL